MKPFILGSFFTLFVVTIGMNQLYLRVNPSRSYHQKHRHQQSEKKDNRQLTESSLFILKKNKPREVRFNYGRRRPVRYKLVPYHVPSVNRYDDEIPLHSYHYPAIPSSLVHRAGLYNGYTEVMVDRSGYYGPPAPTCCSNNNYPSLLLLAIPFGLLLFVFTTITLMQTITITASATAMASSQQTQTQTLMNMNSNTITNNNNNSNANNNNNNISVLIENFLNRSAITSPAYFFYGTDYETSGNDDDEIRQQILRRRKTDLFKLNSLLPEK